MQNFEGHNCFRIGGGSNVPSSKPEVPTNRDKSPERKSISTSQHPNFGYRNGGPDELRQRMLDADPLREFAKPEQVRNERCMVFVRRFIESKEATDEFILVNNDRRINADLILHVCEILWLLKHLYRDEEAYLLGIVLFHTTFHPPKLRAYARKWLEHYFPYLADFPEPTWIKYESTSCADDATYSGIVFARPLKINVGMMKLSWLELPEYQQSEQ